MLILNRKIGEEIIISGAGSKIIIKLLSASGGHSKLGINAPREVVVHRREIYERIVAESLQSIGGVINKA